MTPEELEELVAKADNEGLVKAAARLTASERKKLSSTAKSLFNELNKVYWRGDDQSQLDRLQAYLGKKTVRAPDQFATAELAVVAVGPLSHAKKIRGQRNEFLSQILRDRQPDWIDDWVASAIVGEFPTIDWDTFWSLYRDGLINKPDSEDYLNFMVAWLLPMYQGDASKWNYEAIAAEPELIEDIWRLFEVETPAFTWDTTGDSELKSWMAAVLYLSDQGKMDRGRLLDATVAALMTGFKKNVLSGYANLHDKLEPTLDEIEARQSSYLDLLSASQPQVVNYGIKKLKQIDDAGRLDEELLINAAAPVFDVPTKGPPKTMLSMLKKLASRNPAHESLVSETLVHALGHPVAEIQSGALGFLATMADRIGAEVVQQVADRLGDLPATVRPKAIELLEAAGEAVDVSSSGGDKGLEGRLNECRERIKAIPAKWRKAASVDDAFKAVEKSTWASPLQFEMAEVPVLSGVDEVQPIESLEELIDAVAKAVEEVESGIEVERILDGISRLCNEKPEDFDRRVAPIVKRIKKIRDSEKPRSIGVRTNGIPEISKLLCVWLAGDPDIAKPSWDGLQYEPNILRFVRLRVADLMHRVAAGVPAPLLGMPTHARGWIDPVTLVERVKAVEAEDVNVTDAECILALLRLAPDGRDFALKEAKPLKSPIARPLRWALGGRGGPKSTEGKHLDLWIAAARAREPFGTHEVLKQIGAPENEPNSVHPVEHNWKPTVREEKSHGERYRFEEIKFSTKPAAPQKKAQASRPTSLIYARGHALSTIPTGTAWVYDWVGTLWPAQLDGYFFVGADKLVRRMDASSSTYEAAWAFLTPLFDVDRPWTEMMSLTAVISLAGRDRDVLGLAVDAMVESISDGRLSPELLNASLTKLAIPFWLKLNRLCKSLREVSRISPLHAAFVARALHSLVVAWSEIPKDAHHVLALLQELHAELALVVPEKVREKLAAIKGSGKAAKAAKGICSIESDPASTGCVEARMMTLEARLDRAERWANA